MPELFLPSAFERDVMLSQKAYYGIGGKAMAVAYPESPCELAEILLWNTGKRLPLVLMGAGTNILFSDEPFPGIVISFERMRRIFWISETDLFCEAGAENTAIAEELLRRGRTGGEWLFRLPGQIGSTVRMNARCFGGEISEITAGISVLHADGRLLWRLPGDVFLGYKQTSLMESPEIVAGVVLRFAKTAGSRDIETMMLQHEREREEKHHFDFPSCGSTFKNNYAAGRSSGRIFDELGFRGAKEGGAEVSGHHANFIFNRGGATAADVLRLAGRMRASAQINAGVTLDLEVQCIGRFDRTLLDACGVPYEPDRDDLAAGFAGLWSSPRRDCTPSPEYPRRLIEGPMTGYFGRDREYPPGVLVAVEQTASLEDARREPKQPLLRWITSAGDGKAFTVPASGNGGEGAFLDGLWQFSVSELFLGHGDRHDGYLEFEMTPSADWVALRFSAPRKREEGFGDVSAEPWKKDILRFRENGLFGMEFSYELLEPFIKDGVISLQCCASTGRGEYGLFPRWADTKEPADFHRPAAYFRSRLC
jgi:UDP-N-acetylmuramate dehydrogenase